VELDVPYWRVGSIQVLACLLLGGCVVDYQFDLLVARQIADDLGVDPRDRFELSGPIAVVVGPG
jgi:hypothetical protein